MTDVEQPKPPSELAPPLRTALGYALTNLCTLAAARGWIRSEDIGPLVTWILAGIPIVVGIAHTVYAAYLSQKAQRIKLVAAIPEVKAVVMETAVQAQSIPTPNVVGPSALKP